MLRNNGIRSGSFSRLSNAVARAVRSPATRSVPTADRTFVAARSSMLSIAPPGRIDGNYPCGRQWRRDGVVPRASVEEPTAVGFATIMTTSAHENYVAQIGHLLVHRSYGRTELHRDSDRLRRIMLCANSGTKGRPPVPGRARTRTVGCCGQAHRKRGPVLTGRARGATEVAEAK